MGITYLKRENPTWPEKFLNDSVSWVQGLFYKPASSISSFFEDLGKIDELYEENKVLKQTLAFYARDVARLNALEDENKRLKENLAFTERQKSRDNYTYRIARVVADSPDVYNATIKIDLGEKDGIEVDMAVVTVDGLVGRIERVTPFYSHVQLITELNNTSTRYKAIAATVEGKESDSFGTIENYDMSDGLLYMTKIKQSDPIQDGDVVVTSGLGGVFPEGLRIGTVKSSDVGEFGLTRTAKIEPFADFNHLKEVFVVEVPPLEGEE
ncbi:rod shape-determining protein MreC [Marinicrinis lubricantis]